MSLAPSTPRPRVTCVRVHSRPQLYGTLRPMPICIVGVGGVRAGLLDGRQLVIHRVTEPQDSTFYEYLFSFSCRDTPALGRAAPAPRFGAAFPVKHSIQKYSTCISMYVQYKYVHVCHSGDRIRSRAAHPRKHTRATHTNTQHITARAKRLDRRHHQCCCTSTSPLLSCCLTVHI